MGIFPSLAGELRLALHSDAGRPLDELLLHLDGFRRAILYHRLVFRPSRHGEDEPLLQAKGSFLLKI